MKSKTKIIFVILIVLISISTISSAIYMAMTIGNRSIGFSLIVSTGGGDEPIISIANAPIVKDGMIPIVWDNTNSTWKITTANDPTWYSYDNANKKWANIMLSDGTYNASDVNQLVAEADLGSMFVWIPRYEYKITYYTDSTKTEMTANEGTTYSAFGKIQIHFIDSSTTTASAGYKIHPAFSDGTSTNFANGEWDANVDGIWVSKFEASNSANVNAATTGYIRSVPNVKSWSLQDPTTGTTNKNRNLSDIYDLCKNMNDSTNATTYGISTNDAELDPHMMKNSEWGAVAYLGYSSYGAEETQINVNNYFRGTTTARYAITGFGATAGTEGSNVTPVTIAATNKYNGARGLLASTTGNITGVYDMNGGLNEFTAAYATGVASSAYNASMLTDGTSKYCTAYALGNLQTVGKIGDATKETYAWEGNSIGNGTSTSVNLSITNSYFMRGGGPTNGGGSGIGGGTLGFYITSTGTAVYRGFRPVMIAQNID